MKNNIFRHCGWLGWLGFLGFLGFVDPQLSWLGFLGFLGCLGALGHSPKAEHIEELQRWYLTQCDEDWEHSFGIEITTMDNPGWCLKVDLEDTILEWESFTAVSYGDGDDESPDWLDCKVEKMKFVGYGGPRKLSELINTFLDWAKSRKDWLSVPRPATQEERDLFWYQSLEEEKGPARCQKADCKTLKLTNSVFCRKHHFEQLRGYLPQE